MDEFSGRTVLEADGHVTLPLLPLPGMVLVPTQTLPLQLFQPQVNGKAINNYFIDVKQLIVSNESWCGYVKHCEYFLADVLSINPSSEQKENNNNNNKNILLRWRVNTWNVS